MFANRSTVTTGNAHCKPQCMHTHILEHKHVAHILFSLACAARTSAGHAALQLPPIIHGLNEFPIIHGVKLLYKHKAFLPHFCNLMQPQCDVPLSWCGVKVSSDHTHQLNMFRLVQASDIFKRKFYQVNHPYINIGYDYSHFFLIIFTTWNSEQPSFIGCFSWMTNQITAKKGGCWTKYKQTVLQSSRNLKFLTVRKR